MGNIGEIASKYPKGRTFSALNPEEQDKLAALARSLATRIAARLSRGFGAVVRHGTARAEPWR